MRRNLAHRLAQTKWRHVVVDALKIAWPNPICLVPDANIAVAANGTIKRGPSRAVSAGGIFRIALEMFERSPVLQRNRRVANPRFNTQKAGAGVRLQFTKHPWHGHGDRKPLVDFPETVDAHADQKDDELSVDLGR